MRSLYLLLFLLFESYTSGNNELQIWSRDAGGWQFVKCDQTFVHFHPIQDIRLNEDLDMNCYCTLFDPNLTPSSLTQSEVIYRYLMGTSNWEEWIRSVYTEWRNNTHGYPQFQVQRTNSSYAALDAIFSDGTWNVSFALDKKVNIQIENGNVYLLCGPNGYVDPRFLVSTTKPTTPMITESYTVDNATSGETGSDEEPEEVSESKNKDGGNDDNNLYYTIVGVIAGLIVFIIIIVAVVLICRRQRTIEKQGGHGYITHIMKQQSTISQTQTLYSHNTWKGNAFAGIATIEYDNDGILAPENARYDQNETETGNTTDNEAMKESGSDLDSGHGESSIKDDSSSKMLVFHM